MSLLDFPGVGFSPFGVGAYDLFDPPSLDLFPTPLSSYQPSFGFDLLTDGLYRAPLGISLFNPRYSSLSADVSRAAIAVGEMGAEDWRYDPMNTIGMGGFGLFGFGGVNFSQWPLFKNPWPFGDPFAPPAA